MPIGGQAVIAAIIGGTCGTAAAIWSVGTHSGVAPAVQASPAAVVTNSAPSLIRTDVPVASPPQAPAAVAKFAAASATATTPVPAGSDTQDVRARARAMAARPDVKALVALRESVVRHAEERGETGAGASKQLLADLDRYIEGARELRLKLDAEEFRRTRPLR